MDPATKLLMCKAADSGIVDVVQLYRGKEGAYTANVDSVLYMHTVPTHKNSFHTQKLTRTA